MFKKKDFIDFLKNEDPNHDFYGILTLAYFDTVLSFLIFKNEDEFTCEIPVFTYMDKPFYPFNFFLYDIENVKKEVIDIFLDYMLLLKQPYKKI